jgi:hypothetical protein
MPARGGGRSSRALGTTVWARRPEVLLAHPRRGSLGSPVRGAARAGSAASLPARAEAGREGARVREARRRGGSCTSGGGKGGRAQRRRRHTRSMEIGWFLPSAILVVSLHIGTSVDAVSP